MKYVALVLVLAGCATQEQIAAREAAYLAEIDSRCVKLGFKPGTDAMALCRLQMKSSDDAAEAAHQANIRARRAMNCTTVGNQTTCR